MTAESAFNINNQAPNHKKKLMKTYPTTYEDKTTAEPRAMVLNRDVRIVKNCRIVEYRIVPNSWDQLFANTNTNSKDWKEVWTPLPKNFVALPLPTCILKGFLKILKGSHGNQTS